MCLSELDGAEPARCSWASSQKLPNVVNCQVQSPLITLVLDMVPLKKAKVTVKTYPWWNWASYMFWARSKKWKIVDSTIQVKLPEGINLERWFHSALRQTESVHSCFWIVNERLPEKTNNKHTRNIDIKKKRKGKIKAWHRQKRILKHILEALKAFPSPYFTVVYDYDPTSPYLGWFP